MRTRCTPISLILLSLFAFQGISQPGKYGFPFITNYEYNITGGSEQNWCITQDHRGVMYFGNNEKGVLEFDGVEWRTIPVPNNPIVRSLTTGTDGIVYVGAEAEFGMLEPDSSGNLLYRSLSDSIDREIYPITGVWKTYYNQGKTYFCTFSHIFIYNSDENNLTILETPKAAFVSFIIDDSIFLGDYATGLMKCVQDSFIPLPGGEVFKEMNISGMVRFDSVMVLIGTYMNGLFLFNLETGKVDRSFVTSLLDKTLRSSVITHIVGLNEEFVVSTQYNGIMILDRDGEIKEHITMEEGLISQTITYTFSNENNESSPLWLAHFNGISKIEFNNPIRSTLLSSREKGIIPRESSGLIADITTFEDKLFIATTSGLFYRDLDADENEFSSLPDLVEANISDLHLFTPTGSINLLLAVGDNNTYVIDKYLNVSTVSDRILNPSLDPGDPGQYMVSKIAQDPERPDVIYLGDFHIIGLQYMGGHWKEILRVREFTENEEARNKCIDRDNILWTNTASSIIRLDLAKWQAKGSLKTFSGNHGLPSINNNQVFLDPDSNEAIIGTVNGFYRYDSLQDRFIRDNIYNVILPPGRNAIQTFIKDKDGDYWFSFENEHLGWMELIARRLGNQLEVLEDKSFRRLQNASTNVFYSDPDQGVWFAKSDELFHFDKTTFGHDTTSFRTLIRNVYANKDSAIFFGTNFTPSDEESFKIHSIQDETTQPRIKYNYNNLEFRWSAPFFEQEDRIRYSYRLVGFEDEWSEWSEEVYKNFTNLPFGKFSIHVKAMNIYGDQSLPAAYTFNILRPWYATIVAIVAYIVLGILLIVFLMLYTRSLRIRAELLEKKNAKIEKQKALLETLNEEVTAHRDEIEAQRDSMYQQKDLIDQQNTAITDSIRYARRIQDAVLPAEEVLRFLIPRHFVFYRPRDIVSGDFYWVDKRDETILIALGDCTGHGVPGAFLSVLGISLLNEISSKYTELSTNEILDELRDRLIQSLGQTGDIKEAKDGIDMSLLAINTKTREIQFSGAHHNLYIFNKGEFIEVKGDRMPVGIHTLAGTQFTSHNFKLSRGDSLYLLSDGFPDQFGGEKGKKYGYPRLKSRLSDIQKMIMHDQMNIITEEFDQWKGMLEQLDDVLMIGIKI